MKKCIINFIIVLIVAVASWNVHLSSKTDGMTDEIMASVEALAQESGTASCSCSKRCSDGVTTASCTGYTECRCNGTSTAWNYVECDGVRSYC